MPRPLVIIHGWSDSAQSFQNIAHLIAERRNVAVSVISLGDYVSLSDYVTYDDLVAAMEKAWTKAALPRGAKSVDAIVHSTGGLVIRDWLSRTTTPKKSPVKNLVMLAPANFGSPLAHKGRSFIGRVIKGFGNTEGNLQTGERLLKGLELASPYSWNLALRDRFGDWASAYGAGGILCTVLVGNRGYDGIRSIANEDGSDGTVRLSTANMNCATLEADYVTDPQNPTRTLTLSTGRTAFGVVDGQNHGSITLYESTLKKQADIDLFEKIIAALDVDDAGFDAHCNKLEKETRQIMEAGAKNSATQGFQNTVLHVIDQDDRAIADYLIEFYEEDDDRDLIAKLFHTTALANVHVYGDDSSYRSLYVNCVRLGKMVDKIDEALSISITAQPQVGRDAPVGYRTFNDDDIGAIRILRAQIETVFQENRTLLITLRIRREREDRVFQFVPAGP